MENTLAKNVQVNPTRAIANQTDSAGAMRLPAISVFQKKQSLGQQHSSRGKTMPAVPVIQNKTETEQPSGQEQLPTATNSEQKTQAPGATPPTEITEKSLPGEKKIAAKQWLDGALQGLEMAEPEQIFMVLTEAKSKFFLDDILIDSTEKGKPKIGLVASPPFWILEQAVGNVVTDWAIWGVLGSYTTLRDMVRAKPKDDDKTNITYGPLTSAGFGTYMLADPLTVKGDAGSGPSVSNATWNILLKRMQNAGGASSYYVRGHLLNDNIHGPGDTWSNLTPLTQRTNNHSTEGHLKKVEETVKDHTNSKKDIVCYQVIPQYGRPFELPRYILNALNYFGDQDAAKVAAAESYVPQGLWCKLWIYDKTSGKRIEVLNEYIEQMHTGDIQNEYFIKTATGKTVNFADKRDVWTAAKTTLLAGIATGLGLGSKQAVSLLNSYAGSIGISVEQLMLNYAWSVPAIVALLVAYQTYKSSGVNPWKLDKTKKVKKK
ncbi:DNA/RNA non-specific endonuclease [Mucilaginibacter sp. HMF5004]|uniref:DNA/RNA non-specific endonuclease n=1 Tax=Mucilaginibacter rivuli TaxID=2857527 RepID=UPI001C5DD66A|nr:DNA/RNA non-specific endonuclease [Mucilaginibacter rivuli]MBW4888497.1 DNA/RNA non-specific endonuclease [Mucilaginibacter rivuli]